MITNHPGGPLKRPLTEELTKINGMTILSMTGSLNFQVGIASQDSSSITLSTSVAAATLKDLGPAQNAAVTYSLSGTSDTYRIAASRTALDAVRAAIDPTI